MAPSHYIEKVLKEYNYFDCKPASTPFDLSVKLFKNIGDRVNQNAYASIIGSLCYATDCIRPYIAYVWEYYVDLSVDLDGQLECY